MNRKSHDKSMRYKHRKNLLSKKIVLEAIRGEEKALQSVVRYYEGYINRLSSRELYDRYGNIYVYRDHVLKTELQNKLVAGILKFRIRK